MTTAAIALALTIMSGVQAPRLEESVLDFYVAEFHRVVNLNPDLFNKARPIIREFIQTRFDISMRRQETLQQLRMLVNRQNSSDEDIKRAIRDLAKEDADIQANQDRFLSS